MRYSIRTIEDLRGARITMPGEFEASAPVTVVMALPAAHTDWQYILPEALNQYATITEAFEKHRQQCMLFRPDGAVRYNDTWTRDYCPLQVRVAFPSDHPLHPGLTDTVLLHFGFNGWGLKFAADCDNLVGSRAWNCVECMEYVLEGGSVESNGRGVILTTQECLCSLNRNGGLSRRQAEERLRRYLGAERVVWIEGVELAGDDTDGHIDTMARFVAHDVVVYSRCCDPKHRDYNPLCHLEAQLQAQLARDGYRLVALPHPDEVNDPDGDPMPGTYANFLITPRAVFVPTYNQPEHDREALRVLGEVFPGRETVGVDCRTLLRQHGSLHCATMQMDSEVCQRLKYVHD